MCRHMCSRAAAGRRAASPCRFPLPKPSLQAHAAAPPPSRPPNRSRRPRAQPTLPPPGHRKAPRRVHLASIAESFSAPATARGGRRQQGSEAAEDGHVGIGRGLVDENIDSLPRVARREEALAQWGAVGQARAEGGGDSPAGHQSRCWYLNDCSEGGRRPSRRSGRCSAATLERPWEAPRGVGETPEDAPLTCQAAHTAVVSCQHAGVDVATQAGRQRDRRHCSWAHL